MSDRSNTTVEDREFIALVQEFATYAVPHPDGTAGAWAGMGIRKFQYARRERIGNALLAKGVLQFGEPELLNNSVRIEVKHGR